MKTAMQRTTDDGAHCTSIEAGDRWRDPAAPSGSIRAKGALLSAAFDVFGAGEVREHAAEALGEEVVAVLEGEFDIDAAGEHYRLAAGEAILIPPREPRRFTCVGAKGVLYRAGPMLDAIAVAQRDVSAQPVA